ncbi:MAG TPA: M48 family metallopeptidase [Dongiaceae bacterium]|nr:M48 family metallopeptidase [Dongiaceae bacterium]
MTAVLIFLTLAAIGFDLWLDWRQIAFVRKHEAAIPTSFIGKVTLEEHRRASAYTIAKAKLEGAYLAVNGLFVLLMAYAGGFALLYRLISAQPISAALGGYIGSLALIGCFVILSALVDLPFGLYRSFVLEERFGFNRMTMGTFVADKVKAACLAVAIGVPLVWIIDFAMRHTGALWWLYAWAIWMIFNVAAIFAIKFIAPLFNKYEPLDAAPLRARLEAMLTKCGFRSNGIFKVDGSKRSAHANAYFTGFGAVKRIVLFDTLLEKLDTDEIEAVIAHELGHFKHGHIRKRLLMMAAVSFAMLGLLGWLSGQAWFYGIFSLQPSLFTEMPVGLLVIFMLVAPAITGWFRVGFNHLSRRDEFEADAFAARMSNGDHLAKALLKLQQSNATALAPDPVYSAVHHSHPTIEERIGRLAHLSAPGPAMG